MGITQAIESPRGLTGLAVCILAIGLLVAPVAAQSPSPPSDWGPLAVLDDPSASDRLDAANGPGRIRVSDECVVLRSRGGYEDTLAWRSGDTRWDATSREVVFTDDRRGEVRVSDGDRVFLGGFGVTLGEPSPGPPVVWLVPPGPACPSSVWVVHEIRLLDEARTPPQKQTSRACVRDAYLDVGGGDLRHEIRATARQARWTVRQAETRYCSSRAVERVSAAIAAEIPDILVGGVVSDDPMGEPSIWIKGVASPRVHELVDAAAVPIRIVEGQPYSFAELEDRSQRIADALSGQGYGGVMVGTEVTGAGIIPASVVATPGLPDDPAAILATLPTDLRPFVVLKVDATPEG